MKIFYNIRLNYSIYVNISNLNEENNIYDVELHLRFCDSSLQGHIQNFSSMPQRIYQLCRLHQVLYLREKIEP